jgi:hypothetical protein
MKRFSNAEISEILESESLALGELWAVARFLQSAFYSESFVPDDRWATAVALTPEGETVRRRLTVNRDPVSDGLVSFYMLREFSHLGIFIDSEKTDLELCKELLRHLDTSGDARWPQRFGKELYAKFNEPGSAESTDFIKPEALNTLLLENEKGIFQIGTLLSGPLGFLSSDERREARPSTLLPLWHCADMGCRHLHDTEVKQYKSATAVWLQQTRRLLLDEFGPECRWYGKLDRFAGNTSSPRRFSDMVAVVCECIVGPELSTACARILKTNRGTQLRQSIRKLKQAKGSPEAIAQSLTVAEAAILASIF